MLWCSLFASYYHISFFLSSHLLSSSPTVLTLQELLRFPKLHTLSLQGNDIRDYNDIAQLQGIATLRSVELHGNPIDQLRHYRRLAVAALPQVRRVDSVSVSPRERDECTRWLQMNQMALPRVMKERLPFAEKEQPLHQDTPQSG